MIRTFHSVGHGCFCTERFHNGLTVVYDCGGLVNRKILENEIKGTFPKDSELEVLCISHFDRDHINGLPILLDSCKTIKNLWIPYLTKPDIILLTLNFCLKLTKVITENSDDEICLRTILEPEKVFANKECHITKILPLDNEESDEIQDEEPKNITIKKSCKPLEVSSINKLNWTYIPFNKGETTHAVNMVKSMLNNSNLREYIIEKNQNSYELDKDKFLSDLKDKNKFNNLIKNIRNFFKKQDGLDANNENSLMLYSGESLKTYPSSHQVLLSAENYFQCYYKTYKCCDICNRYNMCPLFNSHCHPFCAITKPGAFYWGDYNASKNFPSDFGKIKNALDSIGVNLIPHHGSIKNFNREILNNDSLYSVICHGKNDKYQHPSSSVCEQILLEQKKLILVTEEITTRAYFLIFKKY